MTFPGSALTKEQVNQIREELERALRRLERSLKKGGNGRSREIDQSCVGRLSRIEALQNQGLTRKLEERERTQHQEVLQALARIDDGTYGLCNDCSGIIGFERLLVFPETRTCGDCRSGV